MRSSGKILEVSRFSQNFFWILKKFFEILGRLRKIIPERFRTFKDFSWFFWSLEKIPELFRTILKIAHYRRKHRIIAQSISHRGILKKILIVRIVQTSRWRVDHRGDHVESGVLRDFVNQCSSHFFGFAHHEGEWDGRGRSGWKLVGGRVGSEKKGIEKYSVILGNFF